MVCCWRFQANPQSPCVLTVIKFFHPIFIYWKWFVWGHQDIIVTEWSWPQLRMTILYLLDACSSELVRISCYPLPELIHSIETCGLHFEIVHCLLQPCRTLPRPITPTSLLDSTCWVVTDVPSAAQLYTDSTGKVVLENGEEAETEDDDGHRPYQERLNSISEKEIYTRLLSERWLQIALTV